MYEFSTDYFYQDMWAMKKEFALTSYPTSSALYDPSKNKVVDKFKDEASEQVIIQFVELKPKIHSSQTLFDSDMSRKCSPPRNARRASTACGFHYLV